MNNLFNITEKICDFILSYLCRIVRILSGKAERMKTKKSSTPCRDEGFFSEEERHEPKTFSPPVTSVSIQQFEKNEYLPWTKGYEEYKWDAIQTVLSANDFAERIGTEHYGYRIDERIVEYPWFFTRLPHQKGKLLDAGSALNHQHLINLPILQNKQLFISTLAPEGKVFNNQSVSYIYEDLREPCFRENYFDWICCISTLEHIGLDNTMLYTSNEVHAECQFEDYIIAMKALLQCLKPGGHFYITVPFGMYVNHKWFQVFDEKMVDNIIATFQPESYDETIFQYKNDCWQYSSREQARNEVYFDINANKNYDPDYAAAARAVACLDLIK